MSAPNDGASSAMSSAYLMLFKLTRPSGAHAICFIDDKIDRMSTAMFLDQIAYLIMAPVA